ncbi:B3/4 domain-containing protein [Bacteroidota bacterium]
MNISLHPSLAIALPDTRLCCIECHVSIHKGGNDLTTEVTRITSEVQKNHKIEDVNQIETIKETKDAYRVLGKDPSRYRPSAEALTRRVVQDKGLYRINNVVDQLNLVSLQSGFSIGGYDLDKINGSIVFGIGRKDEPYEAIGRGELNIENLPVFRDDSGTFGSPTSDSLRTMVTDQTSNFLMIIIDFKNNPSLSVAQKLSETYLGRFADARDIETHIISRVLGS